MLREIGDWFAALFLSAAIAVSALGAAEWIASRAAAAEATAEAFTVAVDAGHGGFDGGATGAQSGTPESGLNLAVAERVRTQLEAAGVLVVMTRTDNTALAATKEKDLAKRKEIISDES
ncbi:MAG: N-acetylmuramoyl-L-alanine amidase, partial [Clostridia bacterium]|nr:N-acetylmuramoyl-L-alanine amidase [Clostridia bacterium]